MKKLKFIAVTFISAAIHGQNTLKLTTGASLKTTGGAVITVENLHLDNDGTINQAAGDGTFRFSGNTNTNISGTNIPVFDRLEMAKINARLFLTGTINITSGIDFTSGLLDLNNHIILLQPAAFLNGESESSRIIGSAGGFVEITSTLNAPSSANPGNLGAVITSSQNLGSTTIRRGHVAQVGNLGTGTSIQRYYDILPSNNGSLNATLRFKYFDAELNGFDENTIVMWKSSDNINWSNQGFSSRDVVNNFVEKTGIPDFSRWTLSSSFNARLANHFPQPANNSAANPKTKDQWLAWPNPADKTLWINIIAGKETKATTTLFDSKGALIRTWQHSLFPGSNLLNIDIKALSAGIYYLITEWDNGKAKGSASVVKL